MIKKEVEKEKFNLVTSGGFLLPEVVSNLQKNARRSETEKMLWWTQELIISGYVQYFWRRIFIICSEDIGNANPMAAILAHALYENSKAASKNFKNPVEGVCEAQIVLYLCEHCGKNRAADDSWQYILKLRKKGVRKEIDDYARDEHTISGRKMGRSTNYWYHESSKLVGKVGENPWEDKLKELDGYKE